MDLNKVIPQLGSFNLLRKYIEVPPKISKLLLTDIRFIDVKSNIPKLITSGDYNSAVNIFINHFNIKRVDKILIFVHLLNELEIIAKMETENLHSKPSEKMVMAGISELNKLGVDLTIWNLANDNVSLYDEIANASYARIFSLQYKLKKESEIRKKLDVINKMERQNKTK